MRLRWYPDHDIFPNKFCIILVMFKLASKINISIVHFKQTFINLNFETRFKCLHPNLFLYKLKVKTCNVRQHCVDGFNIPSLSKTLLVYDDFQFYAFFYVVFHLIKKD